MSAGDATSVEGPRGEMGQFKWGCTLAASFQILFDFISYLHARPLWQRIERQCQENNCEPPGYWKI